MTPTGVILPFINIVKVPIMHIVIMHNIYKSLYFLVQLKFLRKLHKYLLIVTFSYTLTFPGFTRDTSL